MEKLNDFFANLKERFTNPLVFSFLCSWVVINWKVTVALLWYDSTQYAKAGYESIYDLIYWNTNPSRSFELPLYCALAYTFLNPVLKNLIKAFYSWTMKWGESWNLRILKRGSISVEKYMKLRKSNDEKSERLQEIINKENQLATSYDKLQLDMNELRSDHNDLILESVDIKTFMTQLNDMQILNGPWENYFRGVNDSDRTELISIEGGRYYVYRGINKDYVYDLKNFYYDNRSKQVFFVKVLVQAEREVRPKDSFYLINELIFDGNNILTGYENGFRIKYTRR